MDLLTQGLLGATVAQAAARKDEIRTASLIGFCSGLLADADALIRSASDPLLTIEYHRHFSHSVFFIPVGALIASLILWPFLRHKISRSRLYLFALLGYLLSGFLDLCTSYGTHWLWPLFPERLSFNIISIIDPVFSLTLLFALLLGIYRQRTRMVHIGLTLAAAYLMLGWFQHERAYSTAQSLIAQRGQQAERLVVKPTLGNLLLWRSLYQHRDRLTVDAIRLRLDGSAIIYPGSSVDLFDAETGINNIAKNSILYEDLQRFSRFSDHWLAFAPEAPEVLGDMRYSMLPNQLLPIWGIEFDRTNPEQHARFENYRAMSKAMRRDFIDMLMGRSLAQSKLMD